MDGNRRYAKKNEISKEEGYKAGLDQFINFVKYQLEHKIEETSYYALSSDNLNKRPDEELKILKKLLETLVYDNQIKQLFIDNKIFISLKGDLNENHSRLKQFQMKKLKNEFETWNQANKNHQYKVNIAVNYDGQLEILHSFKQILSKIESNELDKNEINLQTIKQNLWFNGQIPQIIVRAGNAPRISGFMLWDSEYSEIYLTKKYWPELTKQDFEEILNWFSGQKRNFGK